MFVTQVHALKSASASIGAADVSAQAEELEAAGKSADMALIQDKLPVFVNHLKELVNNILSALDNQDIENQTSPNSSLLTSLFSFLNDLSVALKSQNAPETDIILEELQQKPLDAKIREMLEQISYSVLMTEFENAWRQLDAFLRRS